MLRIQDLPEIETPWSPIGYLTFKRTYARKLEPALEEDSPTEEFEDSVLRIINACDEQLECGFTKEEEIRVAEYLLSLKASVAGRFLWQLGTATVDRLGLSSLQNCAFVVVDEPIRPFTWAMDMLALGSGVGYNIQKYNVAKLPKVKPWFNAPTRLDDGGADFIVPDSREGWVRLLGKTLKAAFLSHSAEKGSFTFSTQAIRSKGEPIRGFGGTASGPRELVEGIDHISKVLSARSGQHIRPIDALDIMNIIGWIIVAGNVRRSAAIAIGDYDDVAYLNAKNWSAGNIPPWRGMSNNSVVCDDIAALPDHFWDGYDGSGEPYGLINLELSKRVGRLGETWHEDPEVEGYNPLKLAA
jgi:ribonucleoside-triphosphate reductase (thioredoxin)